MTLKIDLVDTRVAADSLLEELWLYYHEIFAEALPDDPPPSLARTVADWRKVNNFEEVPRWTLRRGGTIEAVAVAYVSMADNLDTGFIRIHVSAPHRGNGHARALAGPVFDWLESDERTKLHTSVLEGGAFDPFLERLGLAEAYHDQRSRLVLADLDLGLVATWIDRASERASDYYLLDLRPPLSDEALIKYCDILFQMNTAPKEELETEDEVMTPEMWRDVEKKNEEAGFEINTIVAVHRPTGEYAGSTSVAADLLEPLQGWQWETVVHPNHRGLGLGRWMKAAMIERLGRQYPKMVRIDTDNSTTNAAMLDINLAMGFRPISREVIWQGELATVRDNWGV